MRKYREHGFRLTVLDAIERELSGDPTIAHYCALVWFRMMIKERMEEK